MELVELDIARDLHPVVREEAFLVAREALANAARHAKANEIEVDVFYDRAALRVVIRDDGCGIDPLILRAGGREGQKKDRDFSVDCGRLEILLKQVLEHDRVGLEST